MAIDYLFIGDDFTGASDTLATLAEAGHRVRLFLHPPNPVAVSAERLGAVGLATDLRALPPQQITDRIDALAETVAALSPRIIHYKICSTFDSSPTVGSIGAAVLALERHLDPALTVIVGGQPSLGRYCLFGNLFARGPDGGVHRIDRHPVMSRHPVTPMAEADLRVHLAAQGLDGLALEAWPVLGDGLTARLSAHLAAPRPRILFDAAAQSDVNRIGKALQSLEVSGRPLLVVGASSVAEAFIAGSAHPTTDASQPSSASTISTGGPCLVLAGSRSAVTAAQVDAARLFHRIPIRRADLASAGVQDLAAQAVSRLAQGSNVLLHLLPDEDYRLTGGELADRLATLAAAVFDRHPVRALGVAGGDTSSVVVHRLGFESLAFLHRLDPGVALCASHSSLAARDGMVLLLKGGQVGQPDIFNRFATFFRAGGLA
ncbi:four-carbon acid sugar kinase family protein [Allomesorhizobium camelthorni]|uniref:Four-carbon acid sugar kinase family protein n=1 Tax=Allomesorhizobium camelthorni TaxID=475069 RepID=A0A6G4WEH3_9HYPH|nr:four-carbon acid sugar kinase family protein [Mesorhizobium camelthorni]NGO52593.1 four-carbon acid sugar kinase family protein [Mesorhizobium camelthorni]